MMRKSTAKTSAALRTWPERTTDASAQPLGARYLAVCLLIALAGCCALLREASALRASQEKLRGELLAVGRGVARCEAREAAARKDARSVAAPVAPAAAASYNATAVFCCFDGPAWMQRRYTAVLANALAVLAPRTAVQVFHKVDQSYSRGMGLNPGIARLKRTHGERLTFVPFDGAMKGVSKRSDLMLSLRLWEAARAEAVLLFGSGGAFCSNSPHALEDFVGHAMVDGDGLTLVRRADALAAVRAAVAAQPDEKRYVTGTHGPTAWLAHQLKKRGVADAPGAVKARFAAGARSEPDVLPFAITGTLARVATEPRIALVEQCPEVKLIFPALTEPGCFGAKSTLDKERCVESLCVSHPKASGC